MPREPAQLAYVAEAATQGSETLTLAIRCVCYTRALSRGVMQPLLRRKEHKTGGTWGWTKTQNNQGIDGGRMVRWQQQQACCTPVTAQQQLLTTSAANASPATAAVLLGMAARRGVPPPSAALSRAVTPPRLPPAAPAAARPAARRRRRRPRSSIAPPRATGRPPGRRPAPSCRCT